VPTQCLRCAYVSQRPIKLMPQIGGFRGPRSGFRSAGEPAGWSGVLATYGSVRDGQQAASSGSRNHVNPVDIARLAHRRRFGSAEGRLPMLPRATFSAPWPPAAIGQRLPLMPTPASRQRCLRWAAGVTSLLRLPRPWLVLPCAAQARCCLLGHRRSCSREPAERLRQRQAQVAPGPTRP
jgi:hypothetical protein